jgi:diguanylate cyclase (GGDEF)-like protein
MENGPDSLQTRVAPMNGDPARENAEGKHLTLAIVDGRDRGVVFHVDKAQTTLGRRPDPKKDKGATMAEVQLRDGRASRRHVLLTRREGGGKVSLFAIDLSSRNGTFFNDKKLDCAEVELMVGDLLMVGDTTLKFERRDDLELTGVSRLYEHATQDLASGLANKQHAAREIERLVRLGVEHDLPMAILLLEVDCELEAEAAAHKVGSVLKNRLPVQDLAARFGPRTFLIVLPETSAVAAVRVGSELRLALEAEGPKGAKVHVGVASFPDHGRAAERLFAAAEGALARAKQAGEANDHVSVSRGLPAPVAALVQRLRRIERAIILVTARHGMAVLRISVALVFIWFGALKVTGTSPVEDLVTKVVYLVPKTFALQVLGWTEILVGVLLLFRVALRLAMAMFFVHMPGTFLILLLHPDLAFQHGNPLLLTTIGEFVVKNLVLIAAGIVIVSTVRQDDERRWMRRLES